MKKLITIAFIFLATGIAAAQSDCKPYVPVSEGATWEITNYDKKDKVTGRTAYKLLKKEVSGNDVTFTIKADSYDKKDEHV